MAANLGLNERQAVMLTVGFYMVTALIMVSVNKVQYSLLYPRRAGRSRCQHVGPPSANPLNTDPFLK